MMKYKVGDKIKFVKDCKLTSGSVIHAKSVWEINDTSKEYYLLRGVGDNLFANIEQELVDNSCEKINEAPSVTKRTNDKHHILNGVTKTDGSCDGEKLVSDSEEAKIKGSHYEKSAMQPLEVMQVIMTDEQFKGFLLGNCIKYCMRKNFKGQHDSDEYKARQYAYWLELANMGKIIHPGEDKVPESYQFKVV